VESTVGRVRDTERTQRTHAALAELERRYGVTSAELTAWLAPTPCSDIPEWEIHRWMALLATLDKGEQNE
jgi:hypothetical protein